MLSLTNLLIAVVAAAPVPALHLDGLDLGVDIGGTHHSVKLPELSVYSAEADNHAELLAYDLQDGVEYLLMTVSGASRPGANPDSACGAGIELSLVLLTFAPDRPAQVRHELIDSCMRARTVLKPLSCTASACDVEYYDGTPHQPVARLEYQRDTASREWVISHTER